MPIPPSSPSLSPQAMHRSHTWFIISGLIYLLTGIAAIIYPNIASIAIVQVIAILLIITGLASLFASLFSKYETHRMIHAILALLRITAGVLILNKILMSLGILTLILAAFFILEGILGIIAVTQLKDHRYWPWLLFNSLIALALGIYILVKYPITASWIVGLFYGVNAIFAGISLLLLGCGRTPFQNLSQTNSKGLLS